MSMLLVVVLGLAGLDSGSQRTITLPVVTGQDRITFDANRLSEKDVRRWIQFSPHIADSNSYLVPESLELCIAAAPEYRECGTRDWRAKNFVYNASVNLQKIRERIKELNEAEYPPELHRLVSYVREIQEGVLFFDSQRLKFFQDWQADHLLASFDGIDPAQQCANEINGIRTSLDNQTSYKLATYKWGNCVNHALRTRVGEYPEAEWKNFLLRYSIHEKFIGDDVD